jgi:hypothetical protein
MLLCKFFFFLLVLSKWTNRCSLGLGPLFTSQLVTTRVLSVAQIIADISILPFKRRQWGEKPTQPDKPKMVSVKLDRGTRTNSREQ